MDPGPPGQPGALEDALNALGVDTAQSDRVDPKGEPLPDDYAPLGAEAALNDVPEFSGESGQNPTLELFVAGPPLDGGSSHVGFVELVGAEVDGGGNVVPGTASILASLSDVDNAWVDDDSNGAANSGEHRSLRAAAAGDLDGDGLQETVVAYVDMSVAALPVRVKTIEDAVAGFAETIDTVAVGAEVLGVQLEVADVDGDGVSEVVLALSDASGVEVRLLAGAPGSFTIDPAFSYRVDAVIASSQVSARMAAGNLDYDVAEELVLVVNEVLGSATATGAASYVVFDDANAGLPALNTGPVTAQAGGPKALQVADVDIGDVTGSGVDQVVFAGMTVLDEGCDSPEGVVVVFEDALGGFAQVAAETFDVFVSNCPAYASWKVRFLQVNAFDIDGDGIDELQAWRNVYQDFTEAAPFTLIGELPEGQFLEVGQADGAYVTANTAQIASGDLTGDGREDLVLYHQWFEDASVWGLSQIESVGFARLSTVPISTWYNTQAEVRPLLVPVNLDDDGPVLKYELASHELVFTEPIVIAALAAAPCGDGIGQNLDGCSTTFGNSQATSVTGEVTVSAKASAYVGVKTAANIPFVGEIGADFKKSVTVTASLSAGASYSVETSRRFTSGPLEDSVVFSTVPYDRYLYSIASHPDPELAGGTVEVMLPRTPIVLKVERAFYNDRISATSKPIGASVFDHVVGDLASYPSASRKDVLLAQHGGLENGPLGVGVGTGSEGLGIQVSTEVSAGGSLGIEYETSVDVTAGPALAGFSVGYGVSASLTFASGSSTTYEVSVGDLTPASYAANAYSFGMFTYVQELEGEEFDVINFWVE